MSNILEYVIFIGHGCILSFKLLGLSLIIGFALGVMFAIAKYNNFLPVNLIISFIRGTPVILQLSFVYLALPLILGIKLSILSAGIIAFSLNSSAYIAEVIRSGIHNIPQGQFDAAKTLEISVFYTWKDIILPQVFKNIMPAVINEAISLLKETAIISTIGGMDIMRSAEYMMTKNFEYFIPLCVAASYYYLAVLAFEYIGHKLENKWQKY